MHIITANPSTGANVNFALDDKNATFISNNNNTHLPWYMGQWTTPVTAVLEAYVLGSFLVFLIMFMMCIHRRGCCHMFHHRRRRRVVRYQQRPRVRVQIEQQTHNNMQEDSDGGEDGHEVNSISSRNPATVDAQNGGPRVHDIQRLERALRVAGMA
ncbi:unnamed protein product [Aureobasidium vineae]|uniref:Uncharacterized protein n=1 Tax=Aureobasidium vineae TaxID=2773715 RepID=A0A9N8J8I5_9PEZI|nr:unnamed protein product [Aureobasidium vineae]